MKTNNKSIKRIIFSLLIILFIFTTIGCKKSHITSEEFKDKLLNKGFTVEEKDEGIDESILDKEYVAKDDNENEIVFYEFKEESDSKTFYGIVKYNLNSDAKKTTNINIETEEDNKFIISIDNNYYSLSRISNTMIYAKTIKSNKETINSIIKELGY